MKTLYIFLIVLISTQLRGQASVLKSTDKYVEMIDEHFGNGSLKQKHGALSTKLGGTFNAYYLNKKLVLITSNYGGPFGFFDHSYYIEKDSLVFAVVRKVILKEPENEKEYTAYEKYLIFNTDKNGKTDLTKWPLTVDINNRYYFNHNQVIKYDLKNLNKPVKPLENEIGETTKDLLFRLTTHLEELNPPTKD